jgi:hypothetical protein
VIRWVYITGIVIYGILLWNYRKYSVLTRKFWKNNFCASFPLYFLCVFLVSENLVSKYEQLLILSNIAVSTLLRWKNHAGLLKRQGGTIAGLIFNVFGYIFLKEHSKVCQQTATQMTYVWAVLHSQVNKHWHGVSWMCYCFHSNHKHQPLGCWIEVQWHCMLQALNSCRPLNKGLELYIHSFPKTRIPHFCEEAKSRHAVEKTDCSSLEMYNCYRSCWMSSQVFGKAIIETLKIHNLFIQYPNNTCFSACYNPWKVKTAKVWSLEED